MTKRTDGPSAAVRIRVMKRDRFSCQYCGVAGTDAELEIDHIIPVSKGGSHHISNLTTACRSCNQKKGDNPRSPSFQGKNAAQVKPKTTHHPLVGMWFHTYKDGKINYQGHIVGVDGDVVLGQLFSWIMGEPTEVRIFERTFMYSDQCKLYADNDQMLIAYEKYSANRRASESQSNTFIS